MNPEGEVAEPVRRWSWVLRKTFGQWTAKPLEKIHSRDRLPFVGIAVIFDHSVLEFQRRAKRRVA